MQIPHKYKVNQTKKFDSQKEKEYRRCSFGGNDSRKLHELQKEPFRKLKKQKDIRFSDILFYMFMLTSIVMNAYFYFLSFKKTVYILQ